MTARCNSRASLDINILMVLAGLNSDRFDRNNGHSSGENLTHEIWVPHPHFAPFPIQIYLLLAASAGSMTVAYETGWSLLIIAS
jgi:hypothetical protein